MIRLYGDDHCQLTVVVVMYVYHWFSVHWTHSCIKGSTIKDKLQRSQWMKRINQKEWSITQLYVYLRLSFHGVLYNVLRVNPNRVLRLKAKQFIYNTFVYSSTCRTPLYQLIVRRYSFKLFTAIYLKVFLQKCYFILKCV